MIADRATLDASRAAAADIARDWQASAELAALTRAFAGVDAIERQQVVAAGLLADIAWIVPLLAPLLSALAADPWFQPPFRVAHDPLRIGAMLFECPAASLTATVLSADALAHVPPPRTIAVSGRVAVTRYVAAGGARLLRWDAGTAPADLDVAQAAPAVPLAPLPLRDGAVVTLDGRRHAHLLDGVARDVVTLSFALHGDRSDYVREYDHGSGVLLRAATGDTNISRTQMLLTMLRLMRRTDASAAFDRATRAAPFHLRWGAMREWLALDAGAALPRLAELAADDPNHEVRAAAEATLALVERRRAA